MSRMQQILPLTARQAQAGPTQKPEEPKIVADCVFQAAAAVMIWFQTAKRLVISVRHSGALIR